MLLNLISLLVLTKMDKFLFFVQAALILQNNKKTKRYLVD